MVNYKDKTNVYISSSVKLGDNVTIYPNVCIEGNSEIGDNTIIYPGSFIKDSIIGSYCNIYTSYILNSKIGNNNNIGPYANIHTNTIINNDNKIGCFVEIKNSGILSNTKISHLSYIGDSEINSKVNVGAGVITANYDGVNKNKTIIKDNSFIGCNSVLIAPIEIGNNSFVAAGSTLTNNVKDNSLAIARSRQTNKDNYYKMNKD